MDTSGEMRGACGDEREMATQSSRQQQAHHALLYART
jgi:hypothetical protein